MEKNELLQSAKETHEALLAQLSEMYQAQDPYLDDLRQKIDVEHFLGFFDIEIQLFLLGAAGSDEKITPEEANFLDELFPGFTLFKLCDGTETCFKDLVGNKEYEGYLGGAQHSEKLDQIRKLIGVLFTVADAKRAGDDLASLVEKLGTMAQAFLEYCGEASAENAAHAKDCANREVFSLLIAMKAALEDEDSAKSEKETPKEEKENKTLESEEDVIRKKEDATKLRNNKLPQFIKATLEERAYAKPRSLREAYLKKYPSGKRDA